MKHLTLLCFALSIVYGAAAQDSRASKHEKKIMRLIASLPEVVKANQYVMRHSHGKRQLTTYIDNEPTAEQHSYQLSVSEFNGSALVPHFRFIVDAKPHKVKYWAVGQDKVLSLSAWRKRHYRDY